MAKQANENQTPNVSFDPEEMKKLVEKMTKFGEEIQNAFLNMPAQKSPLQYDFFINMLNAGQTFMDASLRFAEHPEAFMKATDKLMKDNFKLWQYAMARYKEQMEKVSPVIQPTSQDRRFNDPLWQQHPGFDYLKQAYLLFANWIETLAEAVPDADRNERMKIKFYAHQLVDALSPSNFPFANPVVLKKAVETHGESLITGFQKFIDDMVGGGSFANIENTDRYAFKIGKDIAITPGKVIFQNELMQLIQYTPTTEKVNKTPLLIIPAWINKFYILDLRQDNSLVKWLVDQGHTVFMVSWVNPGKHHLDVTFDDYLSKGALTAVKVVQEITAEQKINVIGYCLGGILSTIMLGYLQSEAAENLNSLTLMASPLDFSQAGELLLFTDKNLYHLLCRRMDEKGMLDGAVMGATFNMLRANDLIWSAFINNYLLANEQPQFDMLFWNADVTNLPAKMFQTYIKELFQENNLLQPGRMKFLGRSVDISKAKIPMFLLGTQEDHIAPWLSIYKAIKHFKGPATFVLSRSGHVAGVVNPPAKNKYGYWTNDTLSDDPNVWYDTATYHTGSWWIAWQQWIETKVHGKIDAAARQPGTTDYHVIEDAPGSYVLIRAEEAL